MLKDRLKEIRKYFNKTQDTFAEELKISKRNYKNYEYGITSPSEDLLKNISYQFNVNLNWLFTGEGEMFEKNFSLEKEISKTSYSNLEKTLISTNTDKDIYNLMPTITLQHIGIKPSCGNGTSVSENAEIIPVTMGIDLIQNVFKVYDPKKLKLFTASGDSMEPTIYDCDLLLVDENRQDYNNGGIFIIIINNEWYCKRLRLKHNGDLEIISDNPKYSIEIKHPDDDIEIKIIGKVIRNLSKPLS